MHVLTNTSCDLMDRLLHLCIEITEKFTVIVTSILALTNILVRFAVRLYYVHECLKALLLKIYGIWEKNVPTHVV